MVSAPRSSPNLSKPERIDTTCEHHSQNASKTYSKPSIETSPMIGPMIPNQNNPHRQGLWLLWTRTHRTAPILKEEETSLPTEVEKAQTEDLGRSFPLHFLLFHKVAISLMWTLSIQIRGSAIRNWMSIATCGWWLLSWTGQVLCDCDVQHSCWHTVSAHKRLTTGGTEAMTPCWLLFQDTPKAFARIL